MKRIRTRSGATYLVTVGGEVARPETEAHIKWTVDNHQYTEGILNVLAGQTYDNIKVGERLMWLGVINDFTEPVLSSLVESIEEI